MARGQVPGARCRVPHQLEIETQLDFTSGHKQAQVIRQTSMSALAIYRQFRSIADHTRLYRYYSAICTLSLAFIRMDHLPEIRKDKWYVFVLHC